VEVEGKGVEHSDSLRVHAAVSLVVRLHDEIEGDKPLLATPSTLPEGYTVLRWTLLLSKDSNTLLRWLRKTGRIGMMHSGGIWTTRPMVGQKVGSLFWPCFQPYRLERS
jgi:hypothetical protein